jgi:16S rRNA (uracil1498-N3)-methyltransferase
MHRFFLPGSCITRDTISVTGELVHRLRNVLRLKKGDHIVVLDDTGWEYDVELSTISRERIEGQVTGKALAAGEPRTRIILYQALLKGSSFELVLQMCTEIGVAGFVPVISERCVAREPAGSRITRWEDIILEAAQQSRRGRLPVLHNVVRFREACDSPEGISFLPWEDEHDKSVRDVLSGILSGEGVPEINVFIGPEGGFSGDEVEYARSRGITPVSLGGRILKAETAGLVATAVTFYELGELESRR